ncbi:MAG: hypothetical protein HY762_08505 [Planctomycetes bacterium]|nr:hypothetical protein [Planctomycetota bacterium]
MQNTSDWKAQIADRITELKQTLHKLESHFYKVDSMLPPEPDNPHKKLGRLEGLDRVVFITPYVLRRLGADINNAQIDDAIGQAVLEVLNGLESGLKGAVAWIIDDKIQDAVKLTDVIPQLARKYTDHPPAFKGRFFRDFLRIAPDFKLMLWLSEYLEGIPQSAVNGTIRRQRPKLPEMDDYNSAESWFNYYKKEAQFEEVIIALIDKEGLTEESLQKGSKLMRQEYDEINRAGQQFVEYYQQIETRGAVFDDENPEAFLDLSEIPELENDDEGEPTSYADSESPEPWARSLPQINDWNKHIREQDYEDDDEDEDFESDPVYKILKPFVHNILSTLRREFDKQARKSSEPVRAPIDDYVAILALKSHARVASHRVWVNMAKNPAPRYGVYMFAMECLAQIGQATEKFPRPYLKQIAIDAVKVRERIAKLVPK